MADAAGPSRGGDTTQFETSAGVNVVATFDAMGIREDLLRGLYAYGFEKPSARQILIHWFACSSWPIAGSSRITRSAARGNWR